MFDESAPAQPRRDVVDMVSEILDIVRSQQRSTRSNDASVSYPAIAAYELEQEVLRALMARAEKVGMKNARIGGRAHDRAFDAVVGDVAIEIKTVRPEQRNPANFVKDLQRAYERTVSAAKTLGAFEALIVVTSSDALWLEEKVDSLLRASRFPLVIRSLNMFRGNDLAHNIAPWLFD